MSSSLNRTAHGSADTNYNARLHSRIDKLNQSALDLHMVEPEKSHEQALAALELVALTEKAGALYEQGQAESTALLSIYNYNIAQYSEALRLGNSVLVLLRTFQTSCFLPLLVGTIGATFARIGQFQEAAAYFSEMLATSIEQKDVSNEARAHVGMGMVYGETGRLEESLEASKLALAAYERQGVIERQALVHSNISYGYIGLDKYREAIEAALAGLVICEEMEQQPHKGELLNNVGFAFHRMGEYEKSLVYLQKALAHGEKKEDAFLTASINHSIALTYLDRELPEQAIPLLERAAKLAQSCNYATMISRVHRELSKAHRMLGNFEQALGHFEQFYELHSAAFNDSNATRLAALEIKYQTEVAERKATLMQEMNLELEQRVIERTEALQDALNRESSLTDQLTMALDAEEQISKLRAQVITVVSHEFRTPLTVINTSTDLLDFRSERMSDKARAKQFRNIRDSSGYLKGLMDDIVMLDLANSAEFKSYPSPIECTQLLSHVREQAERQFPARAFEFKWPTACDYQLETDLSLLATLLDKLIDNAVSYSDSDTVIIFSATRDEDYLSIAIADRGIGISEADAPHLFEPFFRGDNISTRRGIGLGLKIALSIAHALGGEISAESPGIDCGSTFTIKLPLQKTP